MNLHAVNDLSKFNQLSGSEILIDAAYRASPASDRGQPLSIATPMSALDTYNLWIKCIQLLHRC